MVIIGVGLFFLQQAFREYNAKQECLEMFKSIENPEDIPADVIQFDCRYTFNPLFIIAPIFTSIGALVLLLGLRHAPKESKIDA